MSNANSRSRVEDRDPANDPLANNLQYVSEYDSYGYAQPTQQQTYALQQSHAVREGYHINPNGLNNFYLSSANQPPTAIAASRVKSESNRLLSSQVKNEEVVKGKRCEM
jgi:hypothetical protein